MVNKHLRRLVYSLAVVLVWLGFVVEGSHALFADGAVLTGNTISTGTVDLQVSNSQNSSSTTYADSRPGFVYSIVPGQSDEHYFLLKNVSGNTPLDIDVMAMPQDASSSLMAATSLEFTPVDGNAVPTGNPLGATLAAMNNQHTILQVTIPPGQAQRFKLRASLDSSYAQQNQSLTYDLFFTGTQHLAQ